MTNRNCIIVMMTLLLFSQAESARPESVTLKKRDRIVFFGDSITAGASATNGFISLIHAAINNAHPGWCVETINAGKSGNHVRELQARLKKHVLDKKPAIVFIYIGANDVSHLRVKNRIGTTKDAFEAGLKKIIGKIKADGAQVVLCTPAVLGEKVDGTNPDDKTLDEYCESSRRVAVEMQVTLVDLRKAFMDFLKAHNSANQEMGILTTDRVHLSQAGNTLVAEQMLKVFGVALVDAPVAPVAVVSDRTFDKACVALGGDYEPVQFANLSVTNTDYDIVVYGDSSAAVVAAVAAKREGRSVVLVNPTGFPGGMSASGLGATDFGKRSSVMGIASEFYNAIAAAYDKDYVRSFEPHVGRQVFEKMIADAGVTVVYNEMLDRTHGKGVKMNGKRIQSLTTLSGKTYRAHMFIDASYVGDLMAAAGVTYTVGREAESQYGESLAGVRRGDTKPRVHYTQGDKDHFVKAVDPYVKPGDPKSGLLPYVFSIEKLVNGQGDRKIQAYNYRVCLTSDPKLRIPIEKPEGYREIDHELLLRNFDAGDERLPALVEPLAGTGSKVDWNNMHAVGSDHPGANWEYPEAGYAKRLEIEKMHETYIRGFLWTLANNPRVPEAIRKTVSAYGLPKDEFTDNGGWPWMIYIREARRMVSDYVMTQHDCEGKCAAPDPVGLGSFGTDSHVVQHFVTEDGRAQNDGVIWRIPPKPYGISYRSIIPRRGECENLLVPVCLSASHVAHGSIRMEPVFMTLGESAAIAAGVAINREVSVQDISYPELRTKLEEVKQLVHSQPKVSDAIR